MAPGIPPADRVRVRHDQAGGIVMRLGLGDRNVIAQPEVDGQLMIYLEIVLNIPGITGHVEIEIATIGHQAAAGQAQQRRSTCRPLVSAHRRVGCRPRVEPTCPST